MRPCRLCGSKDYKPHMVKDGFHLERCRQCSLVQITDDLSDFNPSKVYNGRYYEQFSWQSSGGGKIIHCEKLAMRLDEIEELRPKPGKILDVGCAFGDFLAAARERGWETFGIELSEYAAHEAQTRWELAVQNASAREAAFANAFFDVITLWDVVEHLDDLVADLRHLNRFLKKGGLLVFNTPDVDAYLTKLQGRWWRNYEPPRHITYLSAQTARLLLESSGYRLLRATVTLPREAWLKRLCLFHLLRGLRFSDKLLVFAEKEER